MWRGVAGMMAVADTMIAAIRVPVGNSPCTGDDSSRRGDGQEGATADSLGSAVLMKVHATMKRKPLLTKRQQMGMKNLLLKNVQGCGMWL